MLALGALLLLQDRPARERLLSDDTAATPVVEELLRYLSVVQVAFPRFATADMQICGVQIAAGDLVVCSLSGADRDQTLGPGMEHFDPARDPIAHLAFGYGIHRCLGAELARMELRIAYPALLRRYPDITLAVAPEELSFRKSSLVFGLDSLPVTLAHADNPTRRSTRAHNLGGIPSSKSATSPNATATRWPCET